MVRPGDRVLVAVSGGSDSVGLLGLLARLQKRLAIDLVCAHVNHRLRGPDADADEACAEAAARQLGIAFVRARVPPGLSRHGNLEERARQVRYEILRRLARAHGCSRIATGHTEDDQAETVLLRLTRGTGLEGLGGVQPSRPDGVIRPLIECSRASVAEAARGLGMRWREDLSNRDPRFQRTIVRHRVLPLLRELNPRVARALAQASALARAERELVHTLLDDRLRRASESGCLRLDPVLQLAVPLRGHLVRHWLLSRGVQARGLAGRHVESVLALAAGSRAGGSVTLPRGWRVRRRYGLLDVEQRPDRSQRGWAPRVLAPGQRVKLPGGWSLAASAVREVRRTALPRDLWSAACDAAAVAMPFRVRPARRGERVRPLGLGGTRKLSDLFTDRKVPASERWAYPIFEVAGRIVWVPGVVRSEVGRLNAKTERVVRLTARRC